MQDILQSTEDIMKETFQCLMRDVNKLCRGDSAKLENIILRVKIAINKTFGKQNGYLQQLDYISFTPSKYELTCHEHFKEQSFQQIEKKSPQELKESIEKVCLESHKRLPQGLWEKSPREFKEHMLHEIKEGFDLVPISRALNSYVNIFNLYSRFRTNPSSIYPLFRHFALFFLFLLCTFIAFARLKEHALNISTAPGCKRLNSS